MTLANCPKCKQTHSNWKKGNGYLRCRTCGTTVTHPDVIREMKRQKEERQHGKE